MCLIPLSSKKVTQSGGGIGQGVCLGSSIPLVTAGSTPSLHEPVTETALPGPPQQAECGCLTPGSHTKVTVGPTSQG